MKPETLNQTNANTFNATFHQKSAGLSLVIISSAALYFVARAWPMRPAALSSDALPVGYGGLVLTTLLLIIVGQIVLQTVLAIGQGSVQVPRQVSSHPNSADQYCQRQSPALARPIVRFSERSASPS